MRKIKSNAKQLVELDDVYIDSLEIFVNGLAKNKASGVSTSLFYCPIKASIYILTSNK